MSEHLLTSNGQQRSEGEPRAEDLRDLQIHIDLATQDVRNHGEAYLARLNQFLGELDQKLEECDGLYVGGLAVNGPRATAHDKLLQKGYGIGEDELANTVLYIPKACITARQVNPQFYGTGHDTTPVVNLRVLQNPETGLTNPDEAATFWFQIPLASTSLAASYEPAAQAA